MEEKTKGVINKDLTNGEIVIGTHPDKAATGSGHLQVILDVLDTEDTRRQFIASFKEKNPAVVPMYTDFRFTKDESDVIAHPKYKYVSKFIEPFFTFNFGDKVSAIKNEKFGIPVYIGRDEHDFIHIAYVFADKSHYVGGVVPMEKIHVDKAMAGMGFDNGKPKIKVKYITIEDDIVTVNVISMDDIKDLKQLLYKIG